MLIADWDEVKIYKRKAVPGKSKTAEKVTSTGHPISIMPNYMPDQEAPARFNVDAMLSGPGSGGFISADLVHN